MYTITIDCGASFIKGAAITNGKIERKKFFSTPKAPLEEDNMSPCQIESLVLLVKKMILELTDGQTEIKLCIANEMHGFILAREDGTPFTNYISWQKEYGTRLLGGRSSVDLLQQPEYVADIRYTGMPVRGGLPSSNLFYLKRAGFLKKEEQPLYFYTLGDYLLKRLSGKQPVCHVTNAAATGLFDLRKNDWNWKLIASVCEKWVVFPNIGTEKITFDYKNIKIHAFPAIGDQQAALLGAGLEDEKTISFNLGTGAQVSRLISEPLFENGFQVRPFFRGMYLKTIPHLPSGRALNVYIRFIKDILNKFQVQKTEEDIWKILLNEEMKSIESNLTCDLSFFENPITGKQAGSIGNIEEYSLTIGNLAHTIFRQMANNFVWAADQMESDSNKVEKIIFSGGIARKIEKVRKNIIEHYSQTVEVTIGCDETMLGLYYYGNELCVDFQGKKD